LWVGTRAGLSRMSEDGQFTHVIEFPLDEGSDSRPGVRDMAEDEQGRLWVATQTEGLIRLDLKTGERIDFGTGGAEEGGYVRSILIDSSGVIWAGTLDNGIELIDQDMGIRRLTNDPKNPNSLSSNRIWRIFQDNQQRVWVATTRGLNLWLPEKQGFYRYRHDPTQPSSLSDDLVYDIVQDRGNVMWAGTFNGISKWNIEINTFAHIKSDKNAETSLSDNSVTAFAESPEGQIWIGTIGGGLNRWDIDDNHFEHFKADPDDEHSLIEDRVVSMLYDSKGRLWAGTMSQGISRRDPETGKFTNFRFDRNDADSLSFNAVSNILEDRQGRIWIATYGGGLNLYLENGKFLRYPNGNSPSQEFPNYFLVDIEEGLDGRLWLASEGGGVIRFDPETEATEVLRTTPGDSNSLSGNHILSLLQTEDALWVGTRDTGLNRYSDGRWELFNFDDGLPSSAIYGLTEDGSGRIWISHSKGLSNYDPITGEFTNYDSIHGLQGKDFNNGSYLKTADGKILFGGANGFNVFYPDDIQVNTHTPPVRLTRFTKFNREVLLEEPPYELEAIDLSYDDYVVGFEFSALDYTDPTRNQYRYMLAGFDREWVSAKGVRKATYTNLGPGDYTFRVQGSNNDGLWNEEGLSIAVTVDPAPWATWWAMALYTMVAIAVVYGTAQAYSVRLHREEQRRYNEQLEALVAERTAALENEITGHKTAQEELSRSLREKEVLLKEVHHRVKNNMQVISSLLNIQADSIMDQRFQTLLTESQQRIKSMALIHENLYRSDSLLEINFHDYIEMLTNGLVRFYRFDRLAISLDLDVEDIYLDIDTAVPCGLIINELVSNSLKHAYHGREGDGHIRVCFKQTDDGERYSFSVSDDGNGIDESIDLEKSSSMGLEIVRILTEQLDGSWRYESNGGTEFIIDFPRKK
ncbi:MAG: two-component regulator propeller domain-containing protein, partial [Halieaceae bacterium]|nr:two-component regulator propeller domain-containing protein [Halieaceae bacterium]